MATLRQAEGLFELGLWREAWVALDELPAIERIMPPALRLRLDCCPHLDEWLQGIEIAKLLREGTPVNRLAAAHFYLELARIYVEHEEWESARTAVVACVGSLPPGYEHFLKDPVIERLRG